MRLSPHPLTKKFVIYNKLRKKNQTFHIRATIRTKKKIVKCKITSYWPLKSECNFDGHGTSSLNAYHR